MNIGGRELDFVMVGIVTVQAKRFLCEPGDSTRYEVIVIQDRHGPQLVYWEDGRNFLFRLYDDGSMEYVSGGRPGERERQYDMEVIREMILPGSLSA